MQQPHRVSVVIPTYNSATTLSRAVDSVLQQTLRDCEVMIVDDGSRDASLAKAHELATADPRVRVIALPENRGKSHAMNTAIAEVHGAWIAILDADDWYEPDRLATLVDAGETHDVALVADNQRFWDAGANALVRTAFPIARGDGLLTQQAFIANSDPFADFDFGMLKPIVRTGFIRQAGVVYREDARLSEDFLYLLDLFAAGASGFLSARPLYNWTQSFGTVSRQWTMTGAGDWRYDYQSALAAHADALRGLREQGRAPLAALVASRMRAFKLLHYLNLIARIRASGAGLPQLLGAVARHPSIWPLLAKRLLRAALRSHANAR